MLNFSVSVRQSPTQKSSLQFENVADDLSVADLKRDILLKAGLDSHCQLGELNLNDLHQLNFFNNLLVINFRAYLLMQTS